jgi:hypothetical protein
MGLLMGDWNLFVDKQKFTLNLTNITSVGHFSCGFVHSGVTLAGSGYWNDATKRIYFSVNEELQPVPGASALNFTFEGYLVEEVPSGEPGHDILWTLVGTYHVSEVGRDIDSALNRAGWTDFPRREYFGWYANIIETV